MHSAVGWTATTTNGEQVVSSSKCSRVSFIPQGRLSRRKELTVKLMDLYVNNRLNAACWKVHGTACREMEWCQCGCIHCMYISLVHILMNSNTNQNTYCLVRQNDGLLRQNKSDNDKGMIHTRACTDVHAYMHKTINWSINKILVYCSHLIHLFRQDLYPRNREMKLRCLH